MPDAVVIEFNFLQLCAIVKTFDLFNQIFAQTQVLRYIDEKMSANARRYLQ